MFSVESLFESFLLERNENTLENNLFNEKFLALMNKKQYSLPIEYTDADYIVRLDTLLNEYQKDAMSILNKDSKESKKLEKICQQIKQTVENYYLGLPSDAYAEIEELMRTLEGISSFILSKNKINPQPLGAKDPLDLYRVITYIEQNKKCTRKDLFHVPYDLRHNASTARYSIAGYPSLYLGTSIELCFSEINKEKESKLSGWASKYEIQRSNKISVFDLAIKPTDFNSKEKVHEIKYWTSKDIEKVDFKKEYIFWYPFIASASFIRKNKKENFAPEYIIPQLFMQWVRKLASDKYPEDRLYGIRYFSCNSIEDANEGYNYVFPVSGEKYKDSEYCKVLANSFKLTSPIYVKENYHKKYAFDDFDFILNG